MAIIVDANATHLLFNGDEHGAFVLANISAGSTVYITGGKHTAEALNAGMKLSTFRQLALAGRIRAYPDDLCEKAGAEIASKPALKSNDPHIIALAQVSGCRLLYSFDFELCKDFKNKNLLDDPRGKVFQNKKNAALLKKAPKVR